MSFLPDYPGAIVVPAHPTNWRTYANVPKGFVLHTPEEPADNNETTPYYFQNPNLSASTHYYLDNDGDWYQMVQEKFSPIANGLKGKPCPSWANPAVNLNSQTLNIEMEGYAAGIAQTFIVGGPQFNSLVKWLRHRGAAYSIPLDREHIIGHYEVADNRSDPGTLNINTVVSDVQLALAPLEDDMKLIEITGQATWALGELGKRRLATTDEVKAYLKAGYTVVQVTQAEADAIPDVALSHYKT